MCGGMVDRMRAMNPQRVMLFGIVEPRTRSTSDTRCGFSAPFSTERAAGRSSLRPAALRF